MRPSYASSLFRLLKLFISFEIHIARPLRGPFNSGGDQLLELEEARQRTSKVPAFYK